MIPEIKTTYLCALLALVAPCLLAAQQGQRKTEFTIEGQVLDQKNGEPIPYANVYNKSADRGVITDLEGYFKVAAQSSSDSIVVSFIGYQSYLLRPDKAPEHSYEVRLQESAQTLSEIVVKPKDDDFLYELLNACNQRRSELHSAARMAYDLKSFVGNKQVELVEGFYNGHIKGYDLQKLDFKTGRIALQPSHRRFFISTESSRAIVMFKLFSENDYFPINPLSLNKHRLKKTFYLELHQKYVDEKQDSVYVIDYLPKGLEGYAFKGRIWVNRSRNNYIKITLECANALKHPFLPLFPDDAIRTVHLNITRSFEEIDGEAYFKHIDFNYLINYQFGGGQNYNISTNAVLYAYSWNKLFLLPKFTFVDEEISDYRKINAIPYNSFFWKNNHELKLSDQRNRNELFFNDIQSVTNKKLFSDNAYLGRSLLEHPYIIWSADRMSFRSQFQEDEKKNPSFLETPYVLSVKLFMDINFIKDSIQISTATIFDPYESYYHLPVNDTVLCFVNTYFDLVEIERRALEQEIGQSDKSIPRLEALYEARLAKIEELSKRYFKEVKRGLHRRALKEWNYYVFKKLGIDNMLFFKIT